MMNALLIDSDLDTLAALERLLHLDGRFTAIHCCAEPGTAWLQLRRFRPDVVFMEARFASSFFQVDALALAGRIRRTFIRTRIVFISSDSSLAFDAFAVFPLAFVLKPVRPAQLAPVLERLFLDTEELQLPMTHARYALRCFGTFEIVSPQTPAAPVRMPTRLSRDLLAYFITHFERAVIRSEMMADLLPGRQDSHSINLLHVNLYKLRRFLEQVGRILPGIAIQGRYRLVVPEGVCDAVDFARYVRSRTPITSDTIEQAESFAALYRGPLFAQEDYPWAESLRSELEVAHEQLLLRIADFRWTNDEPARSEEVLKALIEVNPLSEDGHCALLDQYLQRNERRKFLSGFEYYRKIMSEELDIAVDSHYLHAYQRMRT